MSTFNAYQKVAIATYADGEFAHVQTMREVADCEDGLFTFLIVELSDNEDCCSAEDACRRIAAAIRELDQVHAAMLDVND